MKKLLLLITSAFTLALTPHQRTAPKVIFFDDFNTGHLDRKKWNVEITGAHYNDELQAYVDSTKTLYEKDGMLVFQPIYSPGYITKDGQKFDFLSARINTRDKFDFQYGKAEARIRIDSGAGLWPAWWMLGYGNWPACGESDIMEFVGEADWASSAVHGPHYSGETPFVNRYYFPAGHDVQQWHTYAVRWTPDSLLFSYDDHLVFRLTRAMAKHYGPWAFDKKEFLILNFALGGAYPQKVNGITKPYYGLSASTLDRIKQGRICMYVDWVRVTQ